jgi:CHAT domain-containing protein
VIRSVAAAACVLLLSGCSGSRNTSVEKEFQEARAELIQGRLPDAQRRIEACERRPLSERDRWRFQLLKADVLLGRGQTSAALPLLLTPLPSSTWSAPLELRRQVSLANAFFRTGKTEDGLRLLQHAQEEAQRVPNASLLHEIETVRSMLLLSQHRFAAAEECLLRAAAASRAAGDYYWLAGASINLSYLKEKIQFRHDEAVRYGEQAIRAAARAGAARALAGAYGNTSLALAQLGEFEKAARYRSEALNLYRQVDDRRGIRESLGEMGNLYAFEERPAEAVKWYLQAFEDSDRTHSIRDAARAAGNLAFAYISLGKWNEAEIWNHRAAQRKIEAELPLVYQTYNSALIAAGRNQWAAAERLYRELQATAKDDPGLQFEAETGLGQASAQKGADAAARRYFESAIRLIESNRDAIATQEYQITFQARMIRAWRNYVDFLMAHGQQEAALDAAERARAHVLEAKLRMREAMIPRSLALGRMRRIAARLHCTLLSYWLGPERSYVWMIDSTGLRARTLPPASEVDRLVSAWQYRIEEQAGDPLETARQTGERLSAILLEGIRPEAGRRLVVVPDGSLHRLNLETLPAPGQTHPLLEDATIVVTPSLAVFASEPGERAGRGSLLVGVSHPGDPAYPVLPNAEAEVRTIAPLCASPTMLLGSAATPAAFRSLDPGRFDLIHFAAHAEANRESPLDSAIILARGGEESKLYAREIAAMRLHASLVTLSACRSAASRTYAGEGLLGLGWAVLSAGARSVVAGLWPVGDRATALLMEDMYAGLGRGLTPAAALHEAKLAMRHRRTAFRQPFYWAPFQVYVRGEAF